IPGAVAAHPAEIKAITGTYSGDQETIVYCACPNKASAAMAAKHLRHAGLKRIRHLLGGIDAGSRPGIPSNVRRAAWLSQYEPSRPELSCSTTMLCATSSLPC